MSRYADNVADQYGRPIAGAQVYVYAQDGSLAALTADGGGALTNPVETDSSGAFSFNADDGLYSLDIWLNGRRLYRDLAIQVGAGVPLPDSVLNALGQTSGANLINWIRAATGAVARTIADWFDDRPSVMDFIPFADRVQIRLRTSTADVRGYIQAAIDDASLRGGGDLLVPAGTYRCVINDTIADRGLVIKDDVRLLAKGATLNLECAGDCYGVRLKNRAEIEGAKVAVTLSVTPGSQSIWHSCISAGDAYGYGGTPGSVSSFHNVTGWRIRDVTVTNVRSGSGGVSAISIYGGANGGIIDGITAPSSATLYGVVQMDWGFVGIPGAINSADIPGSRANFDAGTAYTTHPHDIVARNLNIGDMSRDIAIPVRLAGVHNIAVSDVTIDGSVVAGVYLHAGDPGYEFAQAAVKPYRHKRIVIRNVTVKNARNGNGLWTDCRADNIGTAVGSGYVPLLDPIQRADLTLENIHTYSDGGASVSAGIRIQQIIGVRLINPLATGHKQGILIEEGGDEVTIEGGFTFSNREDGLLAHHGTDKPQHLSIDGLRSYQNNTSGGAFANLRTSGADYVTVRLAKLGKAAETATWNLRADANTTGLRLIDNHCDAGAIGYSIGQTGDYGILTEFCGNTCAAGVTTKMAGTEIITEQTKLGRDGVARRHCLAAKSALAGDTTPASGAWIAGERIYYQGAFAGGAEGSACVTSGSLGTLNAGATTGSITTGTKALTVNSAVGLSVGAFITIAGVSGVKQVTAIAGTAVTIDSNADATVSGASVAYSAPVWKPFGSVAA